MQTKQKDIIIIVSMLLLAITAFLVVHFILKNKTYENSLIKVNYDTIVTIYFEEEKIVQTEGKENLSVIDLENKTITVKGINDHELVIEYDFQNKSMRVISAVCPDQVCVKQNWQKNKPISCAPNKVLVDFTNQGSSGIDGVV